MSQTPDVDRELKALTRQRIRLTWEIAQLGGPLSDEDARLVEVMRDHPEYVDLWGRLDRLSDEQIERDGVNPILHVTIHQTIENQIASGELEQTGGTVEALMRRGMSRHEAIHRIGEVLADEIWHILSENHPFDEAGFVRKLRRLAKPSAAHSDQASRPHRRRPNRKRR